MAELEKQDIEERVQNWIGRISKLYHFIKETLKDNSEINLIESNSVRMHEELMKKFGVQSVNLQVLEIRKGKELLASFKPVGLWVIGANGRLDILTKEGAFILVDQIGKEGNSNWKVYTPIDRKKSIPFDKKFIQELISL